MLSSIAVATANGAEDMIPKGYHPENKFTQFKTSFDAIATWALGVSFLIAGFPHWANSYYFLGSIYAYRLVEPGVGQMVAMSLPIIQLALALCLLTRVFLDAAYVASLILLTSFVAVQTSAWYRDLDISCGCFGPGNSTPIGWESLSLVYGLFALCAIRCALFLFSRPTGLSDSAGILTSDDKNIAT
jgi:uncharacterized membrane protein YphA (DoxX/SURF4 family)